YLPVMILMALLCRFVPRSRRILPVVLALSDPFMVAWVMSASLRAVDNDGQRIAITGISIATLIVFILVAMYTLGRVVVLLSTTLSLLAALFLIHELNGYFPGEGPIDVPAVFSLFLPVAVLAVY